MQYVLVIFVLITSPTDGRRIQRQWTAPGMYTIEQCLQEGRLAVQAATEVRGVTGAGFACERANAA